MRSTPTHLRPRRRATLYLATATARRGSRVVSKISQARRPAQARGHRVQMAAWCTAAILPHSGEYPLMSPGSSGARSKGGAAADQHSRGAQGWPRRPSPGARVGVPAPESPPSSGNNVRILVGRRPRGVRRRIGAPYIAVTRAPRCVPEAAPLLVALVREGPSARPRKVVEARRASCRNHQRQTLSPWLDSTGSSSFSRRSDTQPCSRNGGRWMRGRSALE